MKPHLFLLIGVCLFLGIGVVTADTNQNLTGKWVEEKIDGLNYSGERFNTSSEEDYWIITQQDNLISGTNFFTDGTGVIEEPIAGLISPDGKTISVVDSSGGTYMVAVSDDDTLTVSYLNTGDKKEESNYAFAFSQVLKRTE